MHFRSVVSKLKFERLTESYILFIFSAKSYKTGFLVCRFTRMDHFSACPAECNSSNVYLNLHSASFMLLHIPNKEKQR